MIKTGQTIAATDFIITLVAGEALSALDACYISSSDGKAYKCDADDSTKIGFIGFAQEAASSSASVNLVLSGIVTGFSGLTIGAQYFVSGTAGAITVTAPTLKKIVGVALSATVLKIAEFPTIRLNPFTASGTWTKLPGLKYVSVELVGAGGGGDSTGSADAGGGGGGGGYSKKIIPAASLGATETVTVGAGGAAENNGGSSSFGSHCSATGGNGATSKSGAPGGIGSSGDINLEGGDGGPANGSASGYFGGTGGSSRMGGGGSGGTTQSSGGVSGENGNLYGGGGGGEAGGSSTATGTGGTGAAGLVVVTEFY